MTDVITLTATVYNPLTDQDVPIRLSNAPFNPVGGAPFESLMIGRPSVYREIFADGQAFGVASHDRGTVVASNQSGEWDYLDVFDVAVDGREAVLKIGDQEQGPELHTVMLHGNLAMAPVDAAEATFTIHDRSTAVLDQKVTEDSYLGDNTAPNGVEGDANLDGTSVDFTIGVVLRAPVQLVNEAKHIYVVSAHVPGFSNLVIGGVTDKGAALSVGAQVADLAALEAAVVPSGEFYWCAASGQRAAIRLGVEPQGTLAATLAWDERSAAEIFEGLLVARGEAVSEEDLIVLGSEQDAILGGAFSGSSTLRQVLDAIAETIGAGYWLDKNNVWRIRRIEAPAGVPKASFAVPSLDRPLKVTEIEITRVVALITGRDAGGLPPHTVTLGFDRNHVVETALAGVSEVDREILTTEWRYATTGKSAAIAARHPNAVAYQADTLFQSRAEALAEATRRQNVLGVKRYEMTVDLTPSTAAIELNDVVRLEFRFAPGGALFRVSAIRFDLPDKMVLTVWRPRS
ncbi:MAG: hypothetical protein ACPGOY_06905 [Rhodospirillaceae bacterium]